MPNRNVRLPMRDGVCLQGDIYLPSGAGPFPTLVRKTPYDRTSDNETTDAFVNAGYAVAVVSFRGRFGSEGVFDEFHHEGWLEHMDGYDAIEWAAGQPWSNGAIGTFGVSSDAQWQVTTAPTRPPHLRAMFISYPSDWYGAILQRGVYTGTMMSWHSGNDAFARPLRSRADWADWLDAWQQNELPFLASFVHPEVVDMLLHPTYDEFWRELDPGTRYFDVDVPILHECGWYDRYVRWTFRNFNGIRSEGRERARNTQRVLIGPWLHGGRMPENAGPVVFGPDAVVNRQALMLEWFDRWLRNKVTADDDAAPVRVFLMGAAAWTDWDQWPPAEAAYRRYFLRSTDADVGSAMTGRLGMKPPPSRERSHSYAHDPYDPVPTIGGHGGTMREWLGGPQDNREAEARALTYSTEPLSDDMAVIGEVVVRLFVTSSAVDTDIVITLTDVFPDGFSAVLRQNAIRASTRDGEDRSELLTPGQPSCIDLRLDGVANVFKAGHQLRIMVASSSFPAFLPNPGTGASQLLATKAEGAINTVHHNAALASYVDVPVVANGECDRHRHT